MWKPGPGGKGKEVRKLVLLYLVFYLVLLLVPPGCCCWAGRRGGRPGPGGGPSPLPRRKARGPRGFWRGREPGTASQAGDFLVYDESSGALLTVSEEEFLPGAAGLRDGPLRPREALKAQAVASSPCTGQAGLRGGPPGRGFLLPHGGSGRCM